MNLWYAPQVSRYVKSTYESFNFSDLRLERAQYELVSAAR
jgi:hypothetical protein